MSFDVAVPMASSTWGAPSPSAPEVEEEQEDLLEREPIHLAMVEGQEEAEVSRQDNTVAVGFAGMVQQGDIDNYWSRSMVVQHELFHVQEWMKFGRDNFQDSVDNLQWHDVSSASALECTMQDMAGGILETTSQDDMQEVPSEMRAYTDGAAGYQRLSDGIRAKGDAGGYEAGEEEGRDLGASIQEKVGGVLGAALGSLSGGGPGELSGWVSDARE